MYTHPEGGKKTKPHPLCISYKRQYLIIFFVVVDESNVTAKQKDAEMMKVVAEMAVCRSGSEERGSWRE